MFPIVSQIVEDFFLFIFPIYFITLLLDFNYFNELIFVIFVKLGRIQKKIYIRLGLDSIF